MIVSAKTAEESMGEAMTLRHQSPYHIHGVGPAYTWKLAMSNIHTIGDLLDCLDLPHLSEESHISQGLLTKAQLSTRSIVDNEIIQTAPFETPENPVYYDIETSLSCDKVWLIGLLIDGELHQLYADDWSEEKCILETFTDILQRFPENTLVSYSGTRFDSRALLNAMKRHKVNHEPFRLKAEVDLCTRIRRSFIFPTRGYGLKELGSYLGYPFGNPSLDGHRVAEQYERHVKDGVPLDPRVIEYNGDDVKVLPYICERLETVNTTNVLGGIHD